jgi:hypothetical protein
MDGDADRIARLEAEMLEMRAGVARLERLVRVGDFALMARLVAVVGIGRDFTVEALMDAVQAEREDGSQVLAAAISAAVGRGGGQRVRLGLWLAARCDDPLGGVSVLKIGKEGHATVYQLVEA